MNYVYAATNRYYSKNNMNDTLKLIREKLSGDIAFVSKEFVCLFFDCISNEPCCYWKKDVFEQTYSQLDNLTKGESLHINIDEEVMEHFIKGYKAYQEITCTMNELADTDNTPESLNRIYISIIEGCLTNLFKGILVILDKTSTKNYSSQKNLSPICEVLHSKGFPLLVEDINISVRNAVNHGGVLVRELGREIDYTFTTKIAGVDSSTTVTLNIYELDELVKNTYDIASGVVLGFSRYLNENISSFTISKSNRSTISFSLFAMELSIPDIRCTEIYDVENSKQINLDFYIKITDRLYLMQTAVELAIIVYSRYNNYEQYMIFFRNERLQDSWVRFKNNEILDIIERKREPADVYTDICKRHDCIIWDAATDAIDMQEVKHFKFPIYSNESFKINAVKDASVDDRKRLKAHMFIGDVTDKQKILIMIKDAVDWMKLLKNPPSPTIPHKYGTMEADSVYINVYRRDSRENKGLWQSNENFVCLVDYNIDGITTLKNGGLPASLWQQYHHEKIDNIQISWRERKYATVRNKNKTGRNAPCTCGSGIKYKKCCLK